MNEFPSSIKRVKPTNDNFKITWFLEKACNYDCSYCGDDRHFTMDKKTEFKSLVTLKNHWMTLYDQLNTSTKKTDIHFSGGEVTLNKDFIPFLKWLRRNFDCIDVIGLASNGSAGITYYSELIKYLTHLTFSTHTEYFNEDKFFNTVTHIHKLNNNILYIQLMNEEFNPNNRVNVYREYLTKIGVPFTVMDINFPNIPIETHVNKNIKEFDFG
jgi:molybdenum cofactor biosynthesis enzyme MoaA